MTVASNHVVRVGSLSHEVPTTPRLAVHVRHAILLGHLIVKLVEGQFLFVDLDDLDEIGIVSRCVLIRRTCLAHEVRRVLADMPFALIREVDLIHASELILVGLEDDHMNALEDVGEVLWDSATSTP